MIYSNGLQHQQQPSTPPLMKNANASLSKATGANSSMIYAQRTSIQQPPPAVLPPTDYASRHDLIMNNGHPHNPHGNRQQTSYNQMMMTMNNENVYATRHNGILNRYTGAMMENGGSVRSRATSQPPGSARAPLPMDNYDPNAQQQNGNESQYMAQQSYLPQFIPAAPNHFFEATTTLPRKNTRGFRRRFENLDWAPEQYLEMVSSFSPIRNDRSVTCSLLGHRMLRLREYPWRRVDLSWGHGYLRRREEWWWLVRRSDWAWHSWSISCTSFILSSAKNLSQSIVLGQLRRTIMWMNVP